MREDLRRTWRENMRRFSLHTKFAAIAFIKMLDRSVKVVKGQFGQEVAQQCLAIPMFSI